MIIRMHQSVDDKECNILLCAKDCTHVPTLFARFVASNVFVSNSAVLIVLLGGLVHVFSIYCWFGVENFFPHMGEGTMCCALRQ